MSKTLAISLLFSLIVGAFTYAATEDPAALAEYYYNRHDFNQALQLWEEAWQKDKENELAVLGLCKLRLLTGAGRPACRAVLADFYKAQGDEFLLRADNTVFIGKLLTLDQVFLTNEARGAFLSAQQRELVGDHAGALGLLQTAANLEKGNNLVLRAKARCEFALKNFDAYYATLKQAHEYLPVDREIWESLAEAHLRNAEYERVLQLFQADSAGARSPKEKAAVAIALAETKRTNAALSHIQVLADSRGRAKVAPVVWFYLGSLADAGKGNVSLRLDHYQRFLKEVVLPADGWDPYRLGEKVEVAKALVGEVQARPRVRPKSSQ